MSVVAINFSSFGSPVSKSSNAVWSWAGSFFNHLQDTVAGSSNKKCVCSHDSKQDRNASIKILASCTPGHSDLPQTHSEIPRGNDLGSLWKHSQGISTKIGALMKSPPITFFSDYLWATGMPSVFAPLSKMNTKDMEGRITEFCNPFQEKFLVSSSSSSSSWFTSVLVTYSLLASDWWHFKHTAGDRLASAILLSPVIQTMGKTCSPGLCYVGKLSSPVVVTSLQAVRLLPPWLNRIPAMWNSRAGIATEIQQSEIETKTSSELGNEEDGGRTSILKPMGFSFSAAGLLFPYHLGVTQCLMQHGYINEDTPLAGSSAGAIVCAAVASGVSMQEAMDATKELARDCRKNGTAFRLGSVLRNFLEDFLPEDAHERSNGRIRVAVTQVFSSPRSLLVDQFESREDLINSLITSSFVPGYLAPAAMTRFRDRYCVDGGISSFMPAANSVQTVRICAFPASSLGLKNIDISPDLSPDLSSTAIATMRELFNWALEPGEDHVMDKLFEHGYQNAQTWVMTQSKNKSNVQIL